jgi:hypothetical protein
VNKMKCKCGRKVDGVLKGRDVHRKTREWNCSKCGLIKNQVVIDGEVVREWVAE